MEPFRYRDGVLCAEDVALDALAAAHGTPCYVYSRAAVEAAWQAFDRALAGTDHLVCYAVKANANLAVLDVLARLGSGFDIVSGGELARVLAAGGAAARTVFAGVGKSRDEMAAAIAAGVLSFNVESAAELERLSSVAAAAGRAAPVSLRVNPDVDPQTHPYIATGLAESKFGVPVADAPELFRRAAADPNLEVVGVDCHIGSQQTGIGPFEAVLERLLALVDALRGEGVRLRHLNLGGGMGIRYRDEAPPSPDDYARAIGGRIAERGLRLLIEPGRAVVGNAGVLLARVEYLKSNGARRFAVVDAAMNDLLRPALYSAWQRVLPVAEHSGAPEAVYDVVGPVCESADFLARDRALALAPGDLLAVCSAGAYGFVMSSNYNARPRAAEVLVDGGVAHVARRRERLEDLYALESRLPG